MILSEAQCHVVETVFWDKTVTAPHVFVGWKVIQLYLDVSRLVEVHYLLLFFNFVILTFYFYFLLESQSVFRIHVKNSYQRESRLIQKGYVDLVLGGDDILFNKLRPQISFSFHRRGLGLLEKTNKIKNFSQLILVQEKQS